MVDLESGEGEGLREDGTFCLDSAEAFLRDLVRK